MDSPWAIAPVFVADILVVAFVFVVAAPDFVSGSQLQTKKKLHSD